MFKESVQVLSLTGTSLEKDSLAIDVGDDLENFTYVNKLLVQRVNRDIFKI